MYLGLHSVDKSNPNIVAKPHNYLTSGLCRTSLLLGTALNAERASQNIDPVATSKSEPCGTIIGISFPISLQFIWHRFYISVF